MGILVVDDQADNTLLVKFHLETAGYAGVVMATSADAAFDLLRSDSSIDLILLDILMPGVDGIDACRMLKQDPALKDIPVIMVTARTESDVLDQAFAAGAADFVKKPFDPVELLARVRSALALKAQIDRRRARERELGEANRQLERLARVDALTGLANRRALDETLTAEWRRATREGAPLSLVLVDIDFFKAYNDTYGHPAGDLCLVRVAAVLGSALRRPADLAGRFGGEEFLVLLPETKLEGALAVAERLRAGVEACAIGHARSTVGPVVTVSAGVASARPAVGLASASLLAEADEALYRAKAAGRNRIELATRGEREDLTQRR